MQTINRLVSGEATRAARWYKGRKLQKRIKNRAERRKAKLFPECFPTYDRHKLWAD